MDILSFFTLVITGFAACAEFGSYALVHPVLRQLPSAQHIRVEQGLLRTFGRVMPVLMTLCVVLSVSSAIARHRSGTPSSAVYWASAVSFTAALLSTLLFNVPINRATGRWNADDLPPDWKQVRNRWEFFQGLRSWLLLLGFVLFCLAFTL